MSEAYTPNLPLWLPNEDSVEPSLEAPAERKPRSKHNAGLYAGLITLDQIPRVRTRAHSPTVEMSFEDDHTLMLDGRVHTVIGHRLFVLNALLLNLGHLIQRTDVEKLGFAPGGTAITRQVAFSKAKRSLQESLVYGNPPKKLLFQKFDSYKTGRYQLDSRVEYVFFDRRQKNQ